MLRDYFKKSIDRNIDGVIKASDDRSLRTEFEEYVVTNEINNKLSDFFDVYTSPQSVVNGVWISGFFGTGKSHLLKILSYLIENREIDGEKAASYFKDKGDAELRAKISRVTAIPSKSILFNITSVAKSNADDIVAVTQAFMQAFDNSFGYYGNLRYIAELERSLDEEGLYDKFKEVFQEKTGKEWVKARAVPLMVKDAISEAYAEVTNQSVNPNLLENFREDFKDVTVESFAQKVKRYIDRQPAGFRLNFFVDEVGQYVADNVHKMVVLQSIAEELSKLYKEQRSWVFVTSQYDLDAVLKSGKDSNLSNRISQDFSRIQARFKFTIALTGKNVNEVVQKRLLDKNNAGRLALLPVYEKYSKDFKTIFNFVDGPKTFPAYRSDEEFIICYPFVTYQFDLFSHALVQFSAHNAFTGKFNSVGERSMLDAFHRVAKNIGDSEVGKLVTFDQLYEGLRDQFRPNVYRSINDAENRGLEEFKIKVLKALLMVKYLEQDFKATVHNISVLLYHEVGENPEAVRTKVLDALTDLENQRYIQRNGDVYDYLTSDELELQNDISNVMLSQTAIQEEISNLIFEQTLKQTKIRCDATGDDYPFTKIIDGQAISREYDMGINIALEGEIDGYDPVSLNSGKDVLLVVLKDNSNLIIDLRNYLKTKKFIDSSNTMNLSSEKQSALIVETKKNSERKAIVMKELEECLENASMYIGTTPLTKLSGTSFVARLKEAFQSLINQTYPNLKMLQGSKYTEQSIIKAFDDNMFETSLDGAAEDVFTSIQVRNNQGVNSTVRSIVDAYTRKPYGWSPNAILAKIASLVKANKIEIKLDGADQDITALKKNLPNAQRQDHMRIYFFIEISPGKVSQLRQFIGDYTQDIVQKITDAKKVYSLAKEAIEDQAKTINKLLLQYGSRYSFMAKLSGYPQKLNTIASNGIDWFYDAFLSSKAEELINDNDTFVNPIIAFLNGTSKDKYDKAVAVKREFGELAEKNDKDAYEAFLKLLESDDIYKPQRIKMLEIAAADIEEKAKASLSDIQKGLTYDLEMEVSSLIAFLAEAVKEPARQLETKLKDEISSVTSTTEADAIRYHMSEAVEKIKAMQKVETPKISVASNSVKLQNIRVTYYKAALSNASDVDSYLSELKRALLKEINEGNEVIL